MTRPAVGPRAPKEEFMRALGLNPAEARCEGVYRNMRDEAIATYTRINTDRTNLKDEQQQDDSIQPPFFWHHIREDRREMAVRDTWQNARTGSTTRWYFDLGSTNGDHKPNWVTLWLLYSVFRSRDIRNNRNRRANDGGGSNGEDGKSSDKMMYDPARNSYVPAPTKGYNDTGTT